MKLTATAIRSLKLPTGKREAIIFDDDIAGFGVRIREAGSRTFVFQYALGDRQRRITLGAVTAVDIGKARETAKDLYAAVRLGRDPAGEKAAARVRAAETLGAAVGLFLEHQRARLRPRSYPDVERHLLKHARPLHGMQLIKVERRDIATCITAVAQHSGAVTGNRVRTSLSSFFAWAVSSGMIDANPVIGTPVNPEHARDRVLAAEELRLIWNALRGDHYGAILKLLMLSGQREGEIAGLNWSEIDLARGVISLPAARCKNHRPHTIPVSEPAHAILEAQPRRGTNGKLRDLVFGYGSGPFSAWSQAKTTLDARIAASGEALPSWRVHDIRRSVATGMAEIGVQPHIIEAVLNHVSGHKGGVAGTYNKASYDREKRQALDLWAEHLLAIVEGRAAAVVPLKRA
jgi:integrase